MIINVLYADGNGRHVYEASDYHVATEAEPGKPATTVILTINANTSQNHEVFLSKGDVAYITNEKGITVDTIRT
jgi:hypothetical protein